MNKKTTIIILGFIALVGIALYVYQNLAYTQPANEEIVVTEEAPEETTEEAVAEGEEETAETNPVTNPDNTEADLENAEIILETVQEFKDAVELPLQFDETTVLNDVTAEPNAIRYHYTLIGVETNESTGDGLKKFLLPTLCSTPDTREALDKGIVFEYIYEVENSDQSFFIPITSEDCL